MIEISTQRQENEEVEVAKDTRQEEAVRKRRRRWRRKRQGRRTCKDETDCSYPSCYPEWQAGNTSSIKASLERRSKEKVSGLSPLSLLYKFTKRRSSSLFIHTCPVVPSSSSSSILLNTEAKTEQLLSSPLPVPAVFSLFKDRLKSWIYLAFFFSRLPVVVLAPNNLFASCFLPLLLPAFLSFWCSPLLFPSLLNRQPKRLEISSAALHHSVENVLLLLYARLQYSNPIHFGFISPEAYLIILTVSGKQWNSLTPITKTVIWFYMEDRTNLDVFQPTRLPQNYHSFILL